MNMLTASFMGAKNLLSRLCGKSEQLLDTCLDGVQDKLYRGGKVADVGCGNGASSILMAKAFPNSHIFGFDYDDKSIEAACESAKPSPLRRTSLWACPGQRTGVHGSMDAGAASDKRLLARRFELGQFALQFARVENLRRAVLGNFLQDPAFAVTLESQIG